MEHHAILQLRRGLVRSYKRCAIENPLYQISRIDKLSIGMLGTDDDPMLHAKVGIQILILLISNSRFLMDQRPRPL